LLDFLNRGRSWPGASATRVGPRCHRRGSAHVPASSRSRSPSPPTHVCPPMLGGSASQSSARCRRSAPVTDPVLDLMGGLTIPGCDMAGIGQHKTPFPREASRTGVGTAPTAQRGPTRGEEIEVLVDGAMSRRLPPAPSALLPAASRHSNFAIDPNAWRPASWSSRRSRSGFEGGRVSRPHPVFTPRSSTSCSWRGSQVEGAAMLLPEGKARLCHVSRAWSPYEISDDAERTGSEKIEPSIQEGGMLIRSSPWHRIGQRGHGQRARRGRDQPD